MASLKAFLCLLVFILISYCVAQDQIYIDGYETILVYDMIRHGSRASHAYSETTIIKHVPDFAESYQELGELYAPRMFRAIIA